MNWFYANQTILTAVMTSDFVATPPLMALGQKTYDIHENKCYLVLIFITGPVPLDREDG